MRVPSLGQEAPLEEGTVDLGGNDLEVLVWRGWGCHGWAWAWASLVTQMVKNLPAMQETWVPSLGQEEPLGSHSSPEQAWWHHPPGELPDPGIESASLMSPALVDGFFSEMRTHQAGTSTVPTTSVHDPGIENYLRD